MEDKRIRCYNQETNVVRFIKESMLEAARIQGYFPQPEPESLPVIEMNISPVEVEYAPKKVKPKNK